jgi:regulatory protein
MDDHIRCVILRWLAQRDHSQHEIRQKLKQKRNLAPHEINAVLSDLVQMGWINDSRYAENYIRSRRTKGYGPLRISLELQARGIKDEMIAEHLKITDNAWFAEARGVWQKHFKGRQSADIKERVKQMRFLQYRGYTQEQIKHALGSNAVDYEDL